MRLLGHDLLKRALKSDELLTTGIGPDALVEPENRIDQHKLARPTGVSCRGTDSDRAPKRVPDDDIPRTGGRPQRKYVVRVVIMARRTTTRPRTVAPKIRRGYGPAHCLQLFLETPPRAGRAAKTVHEQRAAIRHGTTLSAPTETEGNDRPAIRALREPSTGPYGKVRNYSFWTRRTRDRRGRPPQSASKESSCGRSAR